MRLVLKNATFNNYGFTDSEPIVAEIAENYGGIGGRIDVVRNFINALGADGTNDIWTKILYLYMPVLSVPGDGVNALYDIIGKGFYPGSYYTIESNRGVGPTTLGNTIGQLVLSAGLVDDDSMSGFCVFTQSSRQTLGSSSGLAISFCDLDITWKANQVEFGGTSVGTSTGFTEPQAIVFSKKVNGVRTVVGRDDDTTSTTEKSSNVISMSGPQSWIDTSIFALCKNLTPEEAFVVADALEDFIVDFNITCINS